MTWKISNLPKNVSCNTWSNRRQSYTDCFIKDQIFQVIWQDTSYELQVASYEELFTSWKMKCKSLDSNVQLWIHELRVQFFKLRVQRHELPFQAHELRVQIHKLRVQSYELKVQIHELRVQIHKFQNQWKLK